MIPGGRPADEDVRELTEQILAGEEFARWRTMEVEWLAELFEAIASYLDWIAELAMVSPALYWLLLLGLTSVALALIAHIVWSIRVALAVPGPAARQRSVRAAPRWAEEAQLLAAQGRFLEGAHHLVLGSIDVLVENGVVELGRADANRILRERLRGSTLPDAVRAEFLDLLDAFEERWFRDRVEDGALYNAWRALHSRLEASVGRKA